MMALLRKAGASGVTRQDAAKQCGLKPSRGIEILRLLRDKRQAECVGRSSSARWFVAGTNKPAAIEPKLPHSRERDAEKGDDSLLDVDDPLIRRPIVHARISANDAPRIQRTKPYSVFNLAAA